MNQESKFVKPGLSRREFIALGSGAIVGLSALQSNSSDTPKYSMYKNLGCGHIGIQANQRQECEYAARFGFAGASVHLEELVGMTDAQQKELVDYMKEKKVRFGSSGLPVEFRRGDEDFKKGIQALPDQAKVLQKLGITRVSTWLLPFHNSLTYMENFKQHQKRLGEAARILKDAGVRLGLEFVGPKTSRDAGRYPFIHTQKEMLELCDAIGTGNMGLLLDSWHWYTSHGTVEELHQLTNDLVVDVHVNDAPKGINVDEQMDMRREVVCATGVIDLKSFIQALAKIGYDGPVACEPFNKELTSLETEARLKKVSEAMDQLFALIES